MKRRIAFGVVGLVLVMAVWLLVVNRPSAKEPVYQGKTAKQWFHELFSPNAAQANDAIKGMGANAVPFLVGELERTNSGWERFRLRNYPKLPRFITRHLSPPWLDETRWMSAAIALNNIHTKPASRDLVPALYNGNPKQQLFILRLLRGTVGWNDTNCVQLLIYCLASTNSTIRINANSVITRIQPDPRAIPELTNLIKSRPMWLRHEALEYLRRIDAKMAEKYDLVDQAHPSAMNSQVQLPAR